PEATASRDLPLEIIGVFEPVSVELDEEQMHDGGMVNWMDLDLQDTIYVANQVVSDELRYNFEQSMELHADEFAEEGVDRP
ncbi:hypothetical protein, partial [Pseudomonas sp. 2995-1]|uniref:hypothetical protein n=1 Tax=Pseudomonas sp. 2995-1 TaxID=1712679 RepID=UPI001C47C840